MKRVYIETFGCQMNEYDTEIVKAVLHQENFQLTASVREADIVLLNTCSVRENANRKVFGRIHAIRHLRRGEPVKIGVIGCMATDFKNKLLDDPRLPVDFIVGPDSYKRLADVINQVQETGEKSFDITLSEFEIYADVYPRHERGVNAWVAVMRGCNNFCSFCVVPFTRGRERSRSIASVMEEVRKIADEGFQQVTLLGQNVNSYRHDGNDFADLLQNVSTVPGIKRIRFTSPHPKDLPESLLQVVAENPKVCKHIHFPLQAGSTRVLDLMRRTYSREDYLKLVQHIRDSCPDMVLSTDIIVGFPTETDADFQETLDVVRQVQFDSAFIFKYSERNGTIAQKKYPNDVPEPVKTERIVQLNEIQKAISLKKNLAHVGQEHLVLIEREATKKSAEDVQGRNDGNKLVILPGGDHRIGQFFKVEITAATAHVLKGRVLDVPAF